MQPAGSSKTVVIRGRVVKPESAEELGRGGLSAAIRTLRRALAIDPALRPPSPELSLQSFMTEAPLADASSYTHFRFSD
jgi:hypothetical protein